MQGGSPDLKMLAKYKDLKRSAGGMSAASGSGCLSSSVALFHGYKKRLDRTA